MFQLSKKVEYALIAMRHMAIVRGTGVVTAKEIADKYALPYDLLAKVMQTLARRRFISSYQGVKGGYILRLDPGTVKVSEVINAIEGKQTVSIIQCEVDSLESCSIHSTCTIKIPLIKLQSNINSILNGMSIMEMV
ncbi:MAG TPA: Rrf2 family transcriptional regulator [Bacteroidota bacterium]|nr:Rrf2 family transcriptional regulator [Bacteroidota bacterium]